MKKIIRFKNLDCANCAAKMERGIQKLSGVEAASVSFLTQKLTLEAPEEQMETLLPEIVKVCKKIERDCELIL